MQYTPGHERETQAKCYIRMYAMSTSEFLYVIDSTCGQSIIYWDRCVSTFASRGTYFLAIVFACVTAT